MLSTLRRTALRPWALLPLALVVGGGTWFVSRSSDEEDASTTVERTVEVSVGTMSQTVSASGTIEAAHTDELSFSSAGTVTAVDVEAGDEVHAGDVVATLDSPELVSGVEQAEADVADAEAQLESDQDAGASDAQIAADESSLESARHQFDAANEALAGAQLVATIDGTVSAVNLTVGEELGSSGTSGTDMTGSGTGSGQSSGTGSDGGDQSGAPTDGGTDASSSDSSSSPHVEVVSTGSYLVELGIDTTEIDLVEEGQETEVSLSSSTSTGFPGGGGLPGGFPGGGAAEGEAPGGSDTDTDAGGDEEGTDESDSDAAAADPFAVAAEPDAVGTVASVGAIADASSGVASYPVEVTFEGSADDFHVGATVDVEIVYEQLTDALQVPSQAVTTDGGESTVVVAEGDERETRTVETGLTSGGMTQIISGLEEGEQAVITITTGGGLAGGDQGEDGGGGGQFTPPAFGGGGFPGGGG